MTIQHKEVPDMIWDYKQPVQIRFGRGRVSETSSIAASLHKSHGLLVADPFLF